MENSHDWSETNPAAESSNRILTYDLGHYLPTAKALASELRLAILERLSEGSMTMAELASTLEIPLSTAALNIKKLADIGLVVTELVPGTHGAQKVCAVVASRVVLDLGSPRTIDSNQIHLSMPIGHYVESDVIPTCGLVSHRAIIGEFDDPRSFFEPERVNAQLLWFRRGFVEYRFPMRVPHGRIPTRLELSMEACSEAPLFNLDWPSDITVSINGHTLGTWTCPGDFGGERGYLTPDWWGLQNTQHGLLKTWRTTPEGSYLDGNKLSGLTIEELDLTKQSFIAVRIAVLEESENEGGLNLFGRRFGNYEIDLEMRIDSIPRESAEVPYVARKV